MGLADTTDGGSTAQRMVLGAQLRQLRETSGITRGDAGRKIRSSESKISRMELGRVSLKKMDVEDLLTLYGVLEEKEREEFLSMVEDSGRPGWWIQYGELVPKWFHTYIGLEGAASRIQTFELQVIPGILQTERYARAVINRSIPDASPEEINRRVAVRMQRQRLLARPRSPRVWAIIDASVLDRTIGSREIMREQIEYLLEVTQTPNVTLQVSTYESAIGADVAFSLLRFAEPELEDIVYIEYPTGALYLEKKSEVEQYVKVNHRLTAEAETPEASRNLMLDTQRRLG